MFPYAIYRLPYAEEATLVQQTEGEPAEYVSLTELNGKSGFVVAPFEVTENQPILLIRPDKVASIDVSGKGHSPLTSRPSLLIIMVAKSCCILQENSTT